MDSPLVVVSNRGPLSFSHDDKGELVASRGAGGLVSSLGPLVRNTGATWMSSAISEADREAARSGTVDAEGFRYRAIAVEASDFRQFYDVVSNATLWFLHHGLFDLSRQPRFDRRWHEAWRGYRRVNQAFAAAVVDEAPDGAIVLVQDYHLALVGPSVAQERPDLRVVHFSHTPFCEPGAVRVLPTGIAEELLGGMASYDACGFHSRRWARAFAACCGDVLGVEATTFVSPLAPDEADLAKVAASEECAQAHEDLRSQVGERRMILRVDRIELSKNLLRGFWAFDDLLRTHPEWRGQVVFAAFVYPSREGLPEYLAYRQEVESMAHFVNERWGTADWTPVLLDTSDDFPRSVAALRSYDVLLVNPIRDGLNLVAKEGPLLNENDGVLALSREAGAWGELHGVALEVNPFDVAGTADVLATALTMSGSERAAHAAALREVARARNPSHWLQDQLAAARPPEGNP